MPRGHSAEVMKAVRAAHVRRGEVRECVVCDGPFYAKPCESTRRLCSAPCQIEWLRRRNRLLLGAASPRWVEKKHGECKECGDGFTYSRHETSGVRTFCSGSCRSIHTAKRTRLKRTGPEKAMRAYLDLCGVIYLEQYPIKGVGIADFYLPNDRLAIEVDGDWWHSQPANQANDKRKDEAYARLGIALVRVTGSGLRAAAA